MTKLGLIVLAAVVTWSAGAAATTESSVRREVTPRRPDIVEIGEPYSISMAAVENEAGKISQMGTFLAEYGFPDYAEVQEIEPSWPWESYEVRLYYLRRNLELDFGHVFLSEAAPGFGVVKFKSYIPPEKRHEIEVILAARQAPPPAPAPQQEGVAEPEGTGITEALIARVEAAAERAEQAANRAAEASEAAKRAAERTVSIVDQMLESSQ
jgi:hypothetical protein